MRTFTSFVVGALFATTISSAVADRQPLMRDALRNLQQAEGALKNAAHDKGGHRVKALDLTRAAIREVEKGIKFDNRH